uniref:Uncharacterized protein n=1 Tax=Sphaeramia orbicularis TaxID=375764 RepID=A0A673BPX0_9TELE
MLSYQKGQITLPQYKVTSKHPPAEIENSNRILLAPIYFPQELARLEAPTGRRRLAKRTPGCWWPMAYTRYLGDLSGGQVLGKITQKSLGLSSKEGLSFFTFPGVTAPTHRADGGGEGRKLNTTFVFFPQVFDDLQKMLSVTAETTEKSNSNVSSLSANFPSSPIMQFTMGMCVALATVGMGIYAFSSHLQLTHIEHFSHNK